MSQKNPTEIELKSPKLDAKLTARQILTGQFVPPIKIVGTYEAEDFEIFIHEWATEKLAATYKKVSKCSGSGDMGRDIIAVADVNPLIWDNYQCKRYGEPLSPSNKGIEEVGKHIYFSYLGHFTPARKFYFVCSNGLGPEMCKLFENPSKLKEKLISTWDQYCANKIVSKKQVPLRDKLKEYVDAFDFSIFDEYPLQTIVSEHGETKWAPARFGGGLRKTRKNIPVPPTDILEKEQTYVQKLFDLYGEKLQRVVSSKSDLTAAHEVLLHFERQRVSFFSAESLKEFGRDNLPDGGSYDDLLEEFYQIIVEVVEADYDTGWQRLNEVLKVVSLSNIVNHPLASEMFY